MARLKKYLQPYWGYMILTVIIKLLGGDIVITAQRYSKEIENDADNVEAILDGQIIR